MTSTLHDLPELQALETRTQLIRIPDQVDVPVTPRVLELIDTEAFHRLQGMSQLGLVSQVYPAAHHTRFEHSLGVYRMALRYLQRLRCEQRFPRIVNSHDAEVFLVASLFHDLGHWPFCHLVEEIELGSLPRHEALVRGFVVRDPLASILRRSWGIDPEEVADILMSISRTPGQRLLGTLLSGPIDVDKLDYLQRDSLHAGVPYGRNFDQERLIGSLCLNASGDRLAITEKGRTAAEMLVFARYVMFSEVYWHHAVRGATAMLQRIFFRLRNDLPWEQLARGTEHEAIDLLRTTAARSKQPAVEELLEGLFGPRRRLHKQALELSMFQGPELYRRIARRPYAWLVECSAQLSTAWSSELGRHLELDAILVDAPPTKLEVQFDVEVFFPKEKTYRPLADVSPVVRSLAREQFDDVVKRVRIFVSPELRSSLPSTRELMGMLDEAITRTDALLIKA